VENQIDFCCLEEFKSLFILFYIMNKDYSKMDKISLAELATKQYVEKHSKDGIFPVPTDTALFFRIHELAGQPIRSNYTYKEEDRDGSPFRLVLQEIGVYPGLISVAEHYGLNPKNIHEEVRKNMFLKIDFDKENFAYVKMVDNSTSPASNMDHLLALQSKIDNNQPLKELLLRVKREELVEFERWLYEKT